MTRSLPLLALLAALLLPAAARAACDTPRQAVSSWIDNLQPDQDRPAEAVACFDFSRGPSTPRDRAQVARRLLAVLDGQGKYVVYGEIPGEADFADPATGQHRYTLFPTLPEVYLERMDGRWLVSAATVNATGGLYERLHRLPLERLGDSMPQALRGQVLGIPLWRLVALALLLLAAWILGRLFELLAVGGLRRLLARFSASWDEVLENRVLRRSNLLVSAGFVGLLLPSLGLPVRLNLVLFVLLKLTASVAAVLIANSVADLGFDAWARRAAATDTRMDDQLVPLLRRAVKLLVGVVGGLFVLQNLDVDVGSLLAGLGIGGLAFALAAKDTLANLFGSLTIFTDRPFQIGDWVIIGGVEGTVEEVGFRSTRVRTFYNSLVTIPNSNVAAATVDNMGKRRYRRFKAMLGLTYSTTREQMEAFVAGVRASIEASPRTRKDVFEVHFNGLGAHSLDVLVYAFFDVATWTEELQGRQELLLEWMRLAEQLGVEFAFPTQTLHLEGLGAPEAAPEG